MEGKWVFSQSLMNKTLISKVTSEISLHFQPQYRGFRPRKEEKKEGFQREEEREEKRKKNGGKERSLCKKS